MGWISPAGHPATQAPPVSAPIAITDSDSLLPCGALRAPRSSHLFFALGFAATIPDAGLLHRPGAKWPGECAPRPSRSLFRGYTGPPSDYKAPAACPPGLAWRQDSGLDVSRLTNATTTKCSDGNRGYPGEEQHGRRRLGHYIHVQIIQYNGLPT